MAKFIYRMQSILQIKEKLEMQAKIEFAAAQGKVAEEEAKLAALIERKEHYLFEGKQLREQKLQMQDLRENEHAIKRMQEYIEKEIEILRIAEKIRDAAKEKLVISMQEKKIQEILRETAFEEFKQIENAKESKEIDELVTYTYSKKIGEEDGE